MKDFKVNKNSWHFRHNAYWAVPDYARNNSYMREENINRMMKCRKDFCSYWRLTMLNCLKTGVIGVFFAMFVAAVIILLYILGMVFYSNPIQALTTTGIIVGSVATIVGLVFGVAKIKEKVEYRQYAIESGEKEPGIVMAKYKSWKGKYCPMVTYE